MSADAPTPPSPGLAQLRIVRDAAPVRRHRRPWLRWGLAAVVVLGLAAFFLLPRAHPVQLASVVTAWPSQQFSQLTASGYVVAQRRAAVGSKASGRLLELRVREGSRVKQGDILARLDASDVQAGLLAARAGVGQAEAALRQSEALHVQAQAQEANARADLRRTLDLQAQGFISPQAGDSARTRADAAHAATAAAAAAVGQARAALGAAQAQVKVQQVNEDYTLIRAPFDAVVLQKNANVGDTISPFSSAAGTQGAVVTVADMGTLEVEADVSESNVARVRLDQPVEISLDALPELRFRGSVSGIVPTVDRAKATVTTKVRFERLDPRILPEMSAKVSFLSRPATEADQRPVLAVHPNAVAERDGRKVVFRVEGEQARLVPVTPGRLLGESLEVAGALKAGDKVVLSPEPRLKDGARVAAAAAR